MATLTQSYKPAAARIAFARKFDDLLERLIPRRRAVVPLGMITAGLGIPALMVFNILPLSMTLGFVSLALMAVGGVLALVCCGEI